MVSGFLKWVGAKSASFQGIQLKRASLKGKVWVEGCVYIYVRYLKGMEGVWGFVYSSIVTVVVSWRVVFKVVGAQGEIEGGDGEADG